EEVLFMSEKLRYFPNPVDSELNITIPGTDSEIAIEVFSDSGSNLYRGTHSIGASRTIQLPMSRFKSGLYIVTGTGKTVNESFKVIKL
ncbi:MAG: T9SS type A sorting domain-containing protein, partial [Bacteroidetes bacterium]|nr:T9SS type A sorting domain-containing protein [Bacteroidota bacterium]